MTDEFQEIGHTGGTITIDVRTDPRTGQRGYQLTYRISRPNPSTLVELYALPQGIPLEPTSSGGLGSVSTPPSIPGSFHVILGSDSQGQFGHHCPRCREHGYWRSGPWPHICPYCGVRLPSIDFLSKAQRQFIRDYCAALSDALELEGGTRVIDMDAVADAVGSTVEKPAFYVSEQAQQHRFNCLACNEFNDILGRYGYCSACGTRNDLAVFQTESIPAIRSRLNNGGAPENAVRDAVASFDSLAAQYAKQLAALVPLTRARKDRLRKRFHDFSDAREMFLGLFDIDIAKGLKESERQFLAIRFHRRHVFEHNGGEVDETYLRDSGDTTVKLKQLIRESQGDANELLGLLLRVAKNLHDGFHELIPPVPGPIDLYEEIKSRTQSR